MSKLPILIDCEIFMTQPEGYIQPGNEHFVCKLNKSLYRLKQSGRNWNCMLNEFLFNFGCIQFVGDICVYLYMCDKKLSSVILIWVDDIIIATGSKKFMNRIKDHLKGKFKMKDMGKINCFLGIQFVQSKSKIEMDQSRYLQNISQKYRIFDCKPRSTACEMSSSASPSVSDSSLSDNPRVYREIVGSLIYAMTCTRPDHSWVVSKLSQHLANPMDTDWIMLKHVLRYLKGILDYKLSYTKSGNSLDLTGYSNSDWASYVDRRSTTGYYFALNSNGPPVSWKTRKQETVALSSCETEYMALAASTQESLYLINILNDFLLNLQYSVTAKVHLV